MTLHSFSCTSMGADICAPGSVFGQDSQHTPHEAQAHRRQR